MKVILADYSGYTLCREKDIGGHIIKCGLANLLEHMAMFEAGVLYSVILVVNLVDDTETLRGVYLYLQKKFPFIDKVIFRGNVGADFGAYDEGYQYLKSIDYKDEVLFMNSSVRGPSGKGWLLKYVSLFRKKGNIGLCGISLNSHTTHLEKWEFKPHVQSFFMFTSMSVLTGVFKGPLPGAGIKSGSHIELISEGEIAFSQRILEKGYCICSKQFEEFFYHTGNEWKLPSGKLLPCGDLRYSEPYKQFANEI